jgi:hypothetical protein
LNNINTRQGSSLFIPKNTSEIFKYPNSVAFDQLGNIYVGNSNQITKMNTNSVEIVKTDETTDTFSNNLNLNNINTRQGSSLFIPKNTSDIFKYPNSVAFDQLGNIYVGNSNQIIKINKNNKNKSIIAEGFQNNTLDIAVNYTGTYLYATSGSRLIRMNTNGKNRVILSPIFNYLYGVAVNETGNVFVTDTNEIKIMDSNGVLGLVIGYCDFYHLYGINIYKNSIYVVSNYIDNKDGVIEFYNQLLVFNLPSNVNLSEKITVELNENDITQIAGKLPEQVGFHLFNGDTIYISDFYGIYYLT